MWKKIPETAAVEFNEISYYGGKKLVLLSGTEDAVIYYTLDGSEPSVDSSVYSEPFDFDTAGTYNLKAFAYKENHITSAATSHTVSVGTTNPVIFFDENTMNGKTVKITVAE